MAPSCEPSASGGSCSTTRHRVFAFQGARIGVDLVVAGALRTRPIGTRDAIRAYHPFGVLGRFAQQVENAPRESGHGRRRGHLQGHRLMDEIVAGLLLVGEFALVLSG